MVTQLYDTHATNGVARPGFWRRAAAYLVDSALVALAWFAAAFALALIAAAMIEDSSAYDIMIGILDGWIILGLPATWFPYEWFFNARGASPGKSRLDITVVDATGAPPGAGAGFLRTLGMIVGVIPLGLGYWWPIWDREDRAWHDMMAHTTVVRRGYAPSLEREPEPTPVPTEAVAKRPSQRVSLARRSAIAPRPSRPANSVRSRVNPERDGANPARALSVRAALARRRR
jgi:uncharacterized RDD family membrane protein YckC